MTGALAQLTEAVAVLADEATVVELAVRALHEDCPQGAAFGITSRGPRSYRVGTFRVMHGGAFLDLALPHLTYVRTSAIDVTCVPLAQRNRWVEPFAEGISTPEGFKKSTLYPLIKHLGVLDGGRICVCARQRQLALLGVGIPEGTCFSEDERALLAATSAALVVPLRGRVVARRCAATAFAPRRPARGYHRRDRKRTEHRRAHGQNHAGAAVPTRGCLEPRRATGAASP